MTIRVRAINGHDRDAQPDCRTIDDPGNLGKGGYAMAMEDRHDCVVFGYTAVTGGARKYIMTASIPLSARAAGSRFMLESDNMDDDGRALWWLAERIA